MHKIVHSLMGFVPTNKRPAAAVKRALEIGLRVVSFVFSTACFTTAVPFVTRLLTLYAAPSLKFLTQRIRSFRQPIVEWQVHVMTMKEDSKNG